MYNCRSLHIGVRDASYGIRYGMHYGSFALRQLRHAGP